MLALELATIELCQRLVLGWVTAKEYEQLT